MSRERALRGAAIAVLILLTLVGLTMAQQYLSVTSVASKDTIKPGEQVIYTIGVTNNGNVPVYDVTVTDKLPPEATYVSTTAQNVIVKPQDGTLPTDTLEVAFDVIPAGQTESFNVTVTAPTAEEPVILYNYVLVRARNVDQNIFKESKTIVMPDYDKFRAVRSLQDLLINQSHLLLSFEDLLHMVSQNNTEHVSFLQSFEQLLKTQSILISGFQTQLYSTDQSGWTNVFTNEQKIEFLMCYEELLKKEAFLFSSFEDILKRNWCGMGDLNTKKEFLASFEDLLHKQARLYSSFETLQKRLGVEDNGNYTYGGVTKRGSEWKVQFLGSFEALLRLQSDLLLSFQDLMSAPCNQGLDINKTAAWSKCDNCNQRVIYTITVTNLGPNNATGVNLTDYYPAGAVFLPKYNDGWVDHHDGTFTYNLGVIPGNKPSRPVSLILGMPSAMGLGPFVNNVCADSNEYERVCGSVSISRNRTCPEIIVNKTANWGDCKNGVQNANYAITITNKGTCNATGVILTDTYPRGAIFSADLNPGWTDNGNGTLTYRHADIIKGSAPATVPLVLGFTNDLGLGPFNNTVCVYTVEYIKVCNYVRISRDKLCPPLPPRIVVTKTAQWGECKNGVQNATYAIKVANVGAVNITGVSLLDTYPSGAMFNLGQNPGWTNNNNGTLTYVSGDIITPGHSLIVPLILSFSNNMGRGPFVNKVCASTNGIPRVCGFGNISRESLCPVLPKITVTKTAQWGDCNNGVQNATYTIKVTNVGGINVTGVSLLDTYPSGAAFNSEQNLGWTNNNNGTLTYVSGDIITPGHSLIVPLILNFSNNMGYGPFVNKVCASTTGISGVCGFGNISRGSLCPGLPKITVNKTAQWGECKDENQSAKYTIKINNVGTTTVTGVSLLDTYPDGAIFESGNNPGWIDNMNGTLTYSHANIAAGANATVPLVILFPNSMGLGPFTNNVCVYTNEIQAVCDNVTITRDQLCPPNQEIVVNKTAKWLVCNQYADYTITVYNHGDVDATGVTLTDYPPEGSEFSQLENPAWTQNPDGTLTRVLPNIPAGTSSYPVYLINIFINKSLGFGPFTNTVCVDTNEYSEACGSADLSRLNAGCDDN